MMTSRKSYPSDLSDARWALIEPILSAWRAERTKNGLGIHDLPEIMDAILYVNRTGIGWPYLPHDFPPHQSMYVYFGAT
jgi:transposase